MATRNAEMQRFMRYYREQTGVAELDLKEVVKFALDHGWPLPKPETAEERLEKQFRQAAREEVRYDVVTGKPYRANHSFPELHGQQTIWLWIDIDIAPRGPMQKSLVNRREQTVDDMVQLTLDAAHWNRIHPNEEPIVVPPDLTLDVDLRLNAPDEGDAAA